DGLDRRDPFSRFRLQCQCHAATRRAQGQRRQRKRRIAHYCRPSRSIALRDGLLEHGAEIRFCRDFSGDFSMQRELAAEFIGTFSLVSAVCGAALFSAPQAGLLAIAFAVGLSVMAMGFAVGHSSGGHFNPAVICGLVAAGRFPIERAVAYIVVQVIGGAAAAGVFYLVLSGAPPAKWNTFTTISNLYGSGGFTMG